MRRIGLGALLASVLLVPLLISAGNPLRQRIEALEAELNKQAVLLDANGNEVGTWVGHEPFDSRTNTPASAPTAAFFFDGVPPFALTATSVFGVEALRGQIKEVFFASTDCSGPVLIQESRPQPFALAFYAGDGSDRTFLSALFLGVPTTIQSRLDDDTGDCSTFSPQQRVVVPAIPVPQMEGLFTPPFEVVTRGDLVP